MHGFGPLFLSVALGAGAATVGAEPVDVVYNADTPGITWPKLKHHVPPQWPDGVRFGTRGRVLLEARIGADGAVVATNALEATDPRFAVEARRVVAQWRYDPAMLDGQPVDILFRVTVQWQAGGDGGNRNASIVHRVDPVYPEAMIEERKDGEVEFEVRVGTDGKPKGLRVLRSDDPRFTQPAIDAVRQWAFDPAWANDQPVETTEQVTVEFSWREARRRLKQERAGELPKP